MQLKTSGKERSKGGHYNSLFCSIRSRFLPMSSTDMLGYLFHLLQRSTIPSDSVWLLLLLLLIMM